MKSAVSLLLFGLYRKNLFPLWLRFLTYVVATIGLWLWQPFGIVASFMLVFVVGLINGTNWLRYLFALSWAWLIIVFPVLSTLISNLVQTQPILYDLGESAIRSLVLLGIFTASHWYSGTLTIIEVQKMAQFLFRPFGPKIQSNLSLLITLSLSFIPHIFSEFQAMTDAAELRLGRRRNKLKRIAIVGVPLISRLIIRAYRTAEALTIRSIAK